MIFGRPGSGKSTFAYKLSHLTKIPLYHLDKYFFIENWIERDYQEFLTIQESFAQEDSWIIDGNSVKSLEIRYARADLVLYFNYPRWQCLYRIFKRLFNKDPRIDDRAENSPEKVSLRLIPYLWTFEKRVDRVLPPLKEKYPLVPLIEIGNDKELRNFLHSLKVLEK